MKNTLLLLAAITFAIPSFAGFNYGDEITYKVIDSNTATYQFNVEIFAQAINVGILRDSLQVTVYDCNLNSIAAFIVYNTFKPTYSMNFAPIPYEGTYTLPGAGCYRFAVTDPNRTNNTTNITGSGQVPLYVESYLLAPDLTTLNNSARFLKQPSEDIPLGDTVKFSVAASDPDGDCLSYRLVKPLASPTTTVPGYEYPDDPSLWGTNPNIFELDSISGEVTAYFDVPGTYAYSVLVVEWENGQPKGTVLRDVVFIVSNFNIEQEFSGTSTWQTNSQGVFEYTILPGQSLNLTFQFEDNTGSSDQYLFAESEVFHLPNPATFTVASTGIDTEHGTFSWTPSATDVRTTPYTVIFTGKTVTVPIPGPATEQDLTLLIYTSNTKADCYTQIWSGIEEDGETPAQIDVYPNPAGDHIFIDLGEGTAEAGVEIFDVSGKLVLAEEVNDLSPSINISSLETGVYIFRINAAGIVSSGKFVKE